MKRKPAKKQLRRKSIKRRRKLPPRRRRQRGAVVMVVIVRRKKTTGRMRSKVVNRVVSKVVWRRKIQIWREVKTRKIRTVTVMMKKILRVRKKSLVPAGVSRHW